MRAVQLRRYGSSDVLDMIDVPDPEPAAGQAVVRVVASSVNPVDWHVMRGSPSLVRVTSGLTRPKDPRIGSDVAGVVVEVGPDVEDLRPGDAVFGMGVGAWAESMVIRADGLVLKPSTVSWESAGATGVAALTALQGLRRVGRVEAGQRVLVAGAGGGVGHFAVQIALILGARVTATTSADRLDMVRALGPEAVLDYAHPAAIAGSDFDVVFDAGGWMTLGELRRALRPGGVAVLAGAGPHASTIRIAAGLATSAVRQRLDGRRYASFTAKRTQGDLRFLADALADGRLRPVIDRTYVLDEIRQAVRYQETGRARGKVAVAIGDPPGDTGTDVSGQAGAAAGRVMSVGNSPVREPGQDTVASRWA